MRKYWPSCRPVIDHSDYMSFCQQSVHHMRANKSAATRLPDEFPTKESAEIRPQYPYALTKRLGEETVLHWGQVYGLPVVTLLIDIVQYFLHTLFKTDFCLPSKSVLNLTGICKCAIRFPRPLGNMRNLTTQQLTQPIYGMKEVTDAMRGFQKQQIMNVIDSMHALHGEIRCCLPYRHMLYFILGFNQTAFQRFIDFLCRNVLQLQASYDQFNIVTTVHPLFYASRIKDYTEKLVYIPYFVHQNSNESHIDAL